MSWFPLKQIYVFRASFITDSAKATIRYGSDAGLPSLMIHLSAARLLNTDADAFFYLGNVAPDGSPSRERKDAAHLRVAADREAALCGLRGRTDMGDSFALGVLAHLFLDWKWDVSALEDFKKFHGENWFHPYRDEIAAASSWLFHRSDWSDAVWRDIIGVSAEDYGFVPGAKPFEVKAMLSRNYDWHVNNDIGPSRFYRPEYVEAFIRGTVADFREWARTGA